MHFEPIFYRDKLHLVNPKGDIGIITLWSSVSQTLAKLASLGIDLDQTTSRIAVIGNLYGNGLPQLLRNLLWNPQITRLIIVGQDLSDSKASLINFFMRGLEPVTYLGTPAHRIIDTQRIIDNHISPTDFASRIKLHALGKLSDQNTAATLTKIFQSLDQLPDCQLPRRQVPLPQLTVQHYPSEPRQHNILRNTPLEAWRELIFRLVRFGHRAQLKKGDRIELQNVKVTIETPLTESPSDLPAHGFSLDQFQAYQQRILSPDLGEQSYSYGNRLRGYFKHHGQIVDSLTIAIHRLKADSQTRHAYISLWDNSRDLPEGHNCPCLVSLYFRYFDERLTLTATFRTHNAMDAWLENVYGLMAIQNYVADAVPMQTGVLTIISHSITLDTTNLDRAKIIAESKLSDDHTDPATKKRTPRYDHHGNFAITVDSETQELVVQHSYQGAILKNYRGTSAEAIEQQLARDCAISEISHAMYVGRELARNEIKLR